MGLKEYKAKRDLQKSHEPGTSEKSSSKHLNFVVQKHDASHLHYDFRLECHGVLLSWAIPKGPSMNPIDKRLAIHVEDHPLDYQYFEGVIPKGNYGAGTVEIWDHGYFTMPHTSDRKEIEKELTAGMQKGHFAIVMHGEKLHGEFVMHKLKDDEKGTSWLLIKKGEEDSEEKATETKKKA